MKTQRTKDLEKLLSQRFNKVENELYNNYPDIGVFVPIQTPKCGDKDYVYDVYDQLLCIKRARKQELKADKEVILSSMLRSMQRDRLLNFD